VIRRAVYADAPAAAELWLRARAAAARAGTIPPPVHDEDDVRGWFAAHVVPDCEAWVAREPDGSLAGLVVLDGDWLAQLYVDAGSTGRGLGSRLLAHALRERPGGLRLWTFESNAGARRFYERHGFREARRTDGAGNEEGAPHVLYVHPGGGGTGRVAPIRVRDQKGEMASVHKQEHYDVGAEAMWERIGDFHGLHTWHPGVEGSEPTDGGQARILTLAGGGGTIRETRLDEGPASYSYRIDEGPLPVADYTAQTRVEPDGDGCVVIWTAEFEPSGATEKEAVAVIEGIFQSGLDALR
jgi:GNAT superfamily N-acetyltransferase